MADKSMLPFQIGSTAGVTALIDKQELEGLEFTVEDLNYANSPSPIPRTYYGSTTGTMYKRIRIVRNNSGVAILPRQLCMFATGYMTRVTGLQRLTGLEGYLADEFLPAAGCPDKDLFYITVDGCAEGLTSLAADATNLLVATTAGQQSWVTALTAATSQCTTAGRVTLQDTSGVTTALANQIQNRIGLCLSSMTTSNTNAAVLIFVKKWMALVAASLSWLLM